MYICLSIYIYIYIYRCEAIVLVDKRCAVQSRVHPRYRWDLCWEVLPDMDDIYISIYICIYIYIYTYIYVSICIPYLPAPPQVVT